MATPRFREDKAAQAAALLLGLRGGQMSYLKLIKLLYLADRQALLEHGRSITFDRPVSMDKGPVLSQVLNLIRDEPRPDGLSHWHECISRPTPQYEVTLEQDCPPDSLSPAEVRILQAVFKEHGHKGRWQLVDEVHGLPEWTDPQGSAIPIDYSDILIAEGHSPTEVARIQEELDELADMDALFG